MSRFNADIAWSPSFGDF
ncbi:unnamed protein product [Cuscuta epithymum]|uniref:Uncharacterized protein n=1 Tax=Cuscuta epithymum TaxID=186058 RepID=A0AAV0ELC6_9ASTE|nr:unnamed protein product [Cuscuta epithymum]